MDRSDRAAAAFLWRRLARTAAVTGVAVLALWALGFVARTAALGTDVAVMRQRVEAAVRQAFDREAATAQAHAATAASLRSIDDALEGDGRAVRELFDALSAGVARDTGTEATSIYGSDGTPIAWAGRPSDIAADRIRAAGEDWFVLEQVLGLRLVHIRPVDRRLGAVVVTERRIGAASPATAMASLRGSGPNPYRLNTRWATVALEAASGDSRTSPDASRFEIVGPHDRPLLTAIVEDRDLARAREQWAAAVRWAMFAAIALGILFAAGAVLDWRAMTRAAQPGLAAIGLAGCVALARAVLLVEPAASWSSLPLFTAVTYASSALPRLLSSPLDFLLTRRRTDRAGARGPAVGRDLPPPPARRGALRRAPWPWRSAGALLAGIAAAFVLRGHAWVLRDTVAHATVDLLHFSLAPFSASRLALQLGLIATHAAAVTALVTLFRASTNRWLVARRSAAQAVIVAAWVLPTVIWSAARAGEEPAGSPLPGVALALTLAVLLTLSAAAGLWPATATARRPSAWSCWRWRRWCRRWRSTRPCSRVAWRAKSDLVETRYAPQALSQRATVYALARGEPGARSTRCRAWPGSWSRGAGRRINRTRPAIAPSRSGRRRLSRAIPSRRRSRSTGATAAC